MLCAGTTRCDMQNDFWATTIMLFAEAMCINTYQPKMTRQPAWYFFQRNSQGRNMLCRISNPGTPHIMPAPNQVGQPTWSNAYICLQMVSDHCSQINPDRKQTGFRECNMKEIIRNQIHESSINACKGARVDLFLHLRTSREKHTHQHAEEVTRNELRKDSFSPTTVQKRTCASKHSTYAMVRAKNAQRWKWSSAADFTIEN